MVHFCMPAFFISISPCDIHSPKLMLLAGEEIDYDIVSNLFSSALTTQKRMQIVANDPVAAAQFFNIVIDAFTNILLGYGTEEGGSIGHISCYYGGIEEQGKGTLHIHMFVWLMRYSSTSELDLQLEDEDFKNA